MWLCLFVTHPRLNFLTNHLLYTHCQDLRKNYSPGIEKLFYSVVPSDKVECKSLYNILSIQNSSIIINIYHLWTITKRNIYILFQFIHFSSLKIIRFLSKPYISLCMSSIYRIGYWDNNQIWAPINIKH